MSSDPAGFGGGINPYVYAGNNPVNATDPSGGQTEGPFAGLYQHPDGAHSIDGIGALGQAELNANLAAMTQGNSPAVPARGTGEPAGGETGGDTLTTEPVPPRKTIVIGENMRDRVIPFAETNGFGYYRPRGIAESPEGMVNNAQWMYGNIRAGVWIIDIGIDPERPEGERGFNYPMEVNILIDRGYPFVYDPQPPIVGVSASATTDPLPPGASPPGYPGWPWK